MKTILLILAGAMLLGACERKRNPSAAEAGSFFRMGGDVVVNGGNQ